MYKFLLIIFILIFLNLGVFLDVTKTPTKADLIFCLGGNEIHRILTSKSILEKGYIKEKDIYYFGSQKALNWHLRNTPKILNSFKKYKNIKYIKGMKNTMDEMIYINNLIKNNSYKSILIVTSPTHSRRVDFLIKKFNPELINKYTIVSSNPPWWHKNFYFLNLKAISLSFLEFFKLIHNYIKYNFLENTKLERYLDFISNNTKSYLYKNYGL